MAVVKKARYHSERHGSANAQPRTNLTFIFSSSAATNPAAASCVILPWSVPAAPLTCVRNKLKPGAEMCVPRPSSLFASWGTYLIMNSYSTRFRNDPGTTERTSSTPWGAENMAGQDYGGSAIIKLKQPGVAAACSSQATAADGGWHRQLQA